MNEQIRAAADEVVERMTELRNEAAYRNTGGAEEYTRILAELVGDVIAEHLDLEG